MRRGQSVPPVPDSIRCVATTAKGLRCPRQGWMHAGERRACGMHGHSLFDRELTQEEVERALSNKGEVQ